MRYTTLGRSKLRVSALGLGTMTFGTGEGGSADCGRRSMTASPHAWSPSPSSGA